MPLSRIQTTIISGDTSDSVLRSLLVPAAPTGLSVTGGNAQVALSWTAPTGVIAQAPITDYREQFSTDNGVNWTTVSTAASTATTTTLTGLTNGVPVNFRVAAVNGVGVGAYTAASSAITPGIPAAPTGLAATGGNAQVSLTWTAPGNNGGSAITDYSVQFSSNSGSTWNTFSRTASTTASQVVTSLANGTAYVFRVAGINTNGTGTYTAASSSVTPASNTDSFYSNVSLLLNFNNNVTDSSQSPASLTNNNVTFSSSVVKQGSHSAFWSGTREQTVGAIPSSKWISGTEDFTLEFWIYRFRTADNFLLQPTDANGLMVFFGNDGGTFFTGRWNPDNILQLQWSSQGRDQNWIHVAITRQSLTRRVFFDGVLAGSNTDSASYASTSVTIGGAGGEANFNGYLDDVRITKGVARYTSNFTPPSSQLAP